MKRYVFTVLMAAAVFGSFRCPGLLFAASAPRKHDSYAASASDATPSNGKKNQRKRKETNQQADRVSANRANANTATWSDARPARVSVGMATWPDARPAYADCIVDGCWVTLPVPVREGYEFVEWNTELDGSGVACGAGEKIEIEDMTLYAIWQPGRTQDSDDSVAADIEILCSDP